MKLKIGVIFGGRSVEHEVSIISALQAIDYIDRSDYDIVPIYISKNGTWYTGNALLDIKNYHDLEKLKKETKEVVLTKIDEEACLICPRGLFSKVIDKIDIAFPIVHGKNVEDGTLAGYLETIGIPYVGSGVLASSIGQDKVMMKEIFASENLPIVDYIWFFDEEYLTDEKKIISKASELGYPLIVKPASLGSSVGISFCPDETSLKKAISEAILYDHKIIIEKAVEHLTEVNCSVVGNYKNMETSAIEEVKSASELLTYEDKYIGKNSKKTGSKGMLNTSRVIPAPIGEKLTKEIEQMSMQVFRALNLSGICRIDYLIDNKTKKVYINEPNTIPGSLAFYLWTPKNKSYKSLLTELITLSIKDYKDKSKKMTVFNTNILENYHGKGTKGLKK